MWRSWSSHVHSLASNKTRQVPGDTAHQAGWKPHGRDSSGVVSLPEQSKTDSSTGTVTAHWQGRCFLPLS